MIRNWNRDEARLNLLVTVLIGIQFVGLIYNPFSFLPTADEIVANARLKDAIMQANGQVLIPYRSNLVLSAEKGSAIHAVNLFELTGYFLGEVQPAGKQIVSQIQRNICEQQYSFILLDQPMPWFQEQIDLAYITGNAQLMPITDRRSPQLAWQDGYDQVFVPLGSYPVELCFETIN